MPVFRNALAGVAFVLVGSLPAVASATMPFTVDPPNGGSSQAIDIRYVCDVYGCYDRPDYGRPPPPPPGYYRPVPPPPGYYRPAPPPRVSNRHIRWCMDRYRSYDPQTNRYIAGDGRMRVCRSPFR
ncbi:BA14K family protein [Agrobacterium vitis]|uniref:Lectin-like protein BA14k n=1 Tax=Agrobacterium vitis TaxID=373 RepID=A0ABD6GD77_AGRVI|nr:BA14K family protein [Agrobacterium vitis]MUO80494.1 BA14K family protein [Agrobacterium vitis]MUO93887.1 BA14K family protein [Agrobacterium vitis]MUP03862.1 BA14K family protein [Agrobacterium vitis]MUZ83266.1 BA14K family protein [Agrobacterium vitis]MVA10894.1 BA14K family protein [Agrobacterium vitis]